MSNQEEGRDLWSLYGSVPNHRVVPIRALCRARLEGIDPFLVTANLERTARDARDTADAIRAEGGNPEAAERSEEIAEVLDYWMDKPEDLRTLIQAEYDREYGDQVEGNPSTPQPDNSEPCPYENDPNSRNCWGCHAPRKVWEKMERQYHNDT